MTVARCGWRFVLVRDEGCMASESILDFDRLLSPIPGDNPCGADLRWDPIYDEVNKGRPKEERDFLGAEEDAANVVIVGEWPPVIEQTVEVLADRSKDLMFAAWLTEALVHVHGFAGLRDGFQLINGLLENFWDGLYPLPDGDDLEPRAAPLRFLTADGGAKLADALRDVPLTPDRDEIYSWNYWRRRQLLPRETPEKFALRSEEVAEKTARFDEAVNRMSLDDARQIYQDLQAAQEALARFDRIVDERFGPAAPGTTNLRASLQECFVRSKVIFKEKGGFAESSEGGTDDDGGEGASNNGHASGRGGPIRTREDAFQRLAEVAAFLRQKEPQSPIYLLVERAVSWSRMPFDQLLSELIKDAGARHQVGELLGIKSGDGGEGG